MMTDRMAPHSRSTYSRISMHFTFSQLQGFSSYPGIGELWRALHEKGSRAWTLPDRLHVKAFCALQIVTIPIRLEHHLPQCTNFPRCSYKRLYTRYAYQFG